MFSENYWKLFDRNLGIITGEQQQLLQDSCVSVFGLGGIGGVIAEILVRTGIGNIKIIDNDKFDVTNANRQVFAFKQTFGKMKTDISEDFLKSINPDINLFKYTEVTTSNVEEILRGSKVALLAIDSAKPCLLISRQARVMNIPLVEGWAIPFGNVRTFTSSTPSLEECYQFSTIGKDIDSLSQDELIGLKLQMLSELKKIPGIEQFYSQNAVDRIMQGQIPSFAPIVWLTSVLMALEAIKIILNLGGVTYAPGFALYNPFENKVI